MSTAASWAESRLADWRGAAQDVRHLLRFRIGTVRRPRTLALSATVLVLLTLMTAALPALSGAAERRDPYVLDALDLIPTALAGFLVTVTAAAVATGGGRALLTRDEGAVHPLSGLVDHLGALVLAPLNLVWILQAWVLFAAAAFAVPSDRLVAAQVGIALWLLVATACGQLMAWSVEAVRRTAYGVVAVRALGVLLAGFVTGLHLRHELTPLLDALPTGWLFDGLVAGFGEAWTVRVVVELTLLVGLVGLGAVPARRAVRRTPREELRVDGGTYAARAWPRSEWAALVRIDRASVWRAVPVRRGVAVLTVGPALAALIGQLTWSQLTVLPGLVASGAALLFGVNTWALDGRGSLWRESLPTAPSLVFGARAWVLGEFLLLCSAAALVPAVRAGVPTAAEVTAALSVWVVVTAQVLAACMRWSGRRPAAVELRSSRDTPAPPMAMVGYSAKLAVGATLTSLVFSLLSRQSDPVWPVLVAVPFLIWSAARLLAARRAWVDPVARARVVAVVAG